MCLSVCTAAERGQTCTTHHAPSHMSDTHNENICGQTTKSDCQSEMPFCTNYDRLGEFNNLINILNSRQFLCNKLCQLCNCLSNNDILLAQSAHWVVYKQCLEMLSEQHLPAEADRFIRAAAAFGCKESIIVVMSIKANECIKISPNACLCFLETKKESFRQN